MASEPRHSSSFSDTPPPQVARTAEFLAGHGVWFALGRNQEARSCRDAARKRNRLGVTGIPLWDEIKSFFGVIERLGGSPQHLIVHCRGDRTLDLQAVAEAVSSPTPPERLDPQAVERLGMEYGLVNPFEPWGLDGQLLSAPVLQVFDRDLLKPIGVPGTVMTNAGSLTWSVELRAEELVEALDHTIVADVSVPDPDEPGRPAWAIAAATIGIVTGNGPESGMLLWRLINRRVREELGDEIRGDTSMPRVVLASLPEMGLSMELDQRHEAVWTALRAAVAGLCREGAKIIALACNTTPYFAPDLRRICGEYGAEFVSMPEVVGEWLRKEGIRRIALFGVKTVVELGPWSPYREPLADIDVEVPDARAMARIHDLAYQVKSEGPSHHSLTHLRDILRAETKSDTVVLALTELSLLLEIQKGAQRSGRQIVDTMDLYARALTDRYLGQETRARVPPRAR